jgi:hypothetical protein
MKASHVGCCLLPWSCMPVPRPLKEIPTLCAYCYLPRRHRTRFAAIRPQGSSLNLSGLCSGAGRIAGRSRRVDGPLRAPSGSRPRSSNPAQLARLVVCRLPCLGEFVVVCLRTAAHLKLRMIGAFAVCGTKARLASDDDFIASHHYKLAHGFFLATWINPDSSLGWFSLLTDLQEFETRLWYARRTSRQNLTRLAGAPLVTERISEIEVSRRRLRIFLANRLIALGWALKGSCKPCAYRLFTTARWLVPEVQRFLVLRAGSHNRNRRIFELAVALCTLLRIQPRVVAGCLIVLVLLGSLNLAMGTTTRDAQPIVENSAFRDEPQIQPERMISGVSNSPEPVQESVSETASLPRAQIAPVPLPDRKPERVYKVPSGPGTQKRMAQQKGAWPNRMR